MHVRKKDDDSDDDDDDDSDQGSEDASASNKDNRPASQEDVQLDLLVEKDEEELGEAEKALDQVRQELAAAQARTKEALHAVARLKKRLHDREHIVSISRHDRTAWNRPHTLHRPTRDKRH